MNKKIVGIIFLLLIFPIVVSATDCNVHGNYEESLTIADDVPVPVWEVGDSWTFNEHYNEISYRNDGTPVVKWYHNCTSTYTVIDDIGDTYLVRLTSENNEGCLFVGSYRFKYTPSTTLIQLLEHRKTDLAYTGYFHQEKGFVFWLLGKAGIPIPSHLDWNYEISFQPANEIIPFPLYEGKQGTFLGFTASGHQKMSLYFGIIKLSDQPFTYNVPALDYICNMANINVPAGTYETYNISLNYDPGDGNNFDYIYYAQDVGFYVKVLSHGELDGKPTLNYDHELVSTNYQP